LSATMSCRGGGGDADGGVSVFSAGRVSGSRIRRKGSSDCGGPAGLTGGVTGDGGSTGNGFVVGTTRVWGAGTGDGVGVTGSAGLAAAVFDGCTATDWTGAVCWPLSSCGTGTAAWAACLGSLRK